MPVNFEGSWSLKDKTEALAGITDLANILALITGLTPEDAFDRIVGNITFEAVKYLPGGYYGQVTEGIPDRIKFKIGKVSRALVIHELGHIINDNVPATERPAYLLSRYGIKTASGVMVTGPYIGGYSRNMGKYSPKNGYIKSSYPDHFHSRKMKDGNNSLEDFADMLLSLVNNNFAQNEAGEALYNWITNHLVERSKR